jgi:hypothetical protein
VPTNVPTKIPTPSPTNGDTRYYADGKDTGIKLLKTTVKATITFDEDSLEQEHNYTPMCANNDVVYGIGIYRSGLARRYQLGQNFAALLRGLVAAAAAALLAERV